MSAGPVARECPFNSPVVRLCRGSDRTGARLVANLRRLSHDIRFRWSSSEAASSRSICSNAPGNKGVTA